MSHLGNSRFTIRMQLNPAAKLYFALPAMTGMGWLKRLRM